MSTQKARETKSPFYLFIPRIDSASESWEISAARASLLDAYVMDYRTRYRLGVMITYMQHADKRFSHSSLQ